MKKAVIISCFNWFERRLYFLRQELINNGYDVLCYVSDYHHINKSNVTDNNNGILSLIHVPRYTKNISIRRMYSHCIFSFCCYHHLCEIKPELIYVVVPPNSAGKIVTMYKKKYPQVKIIVDIIDLWPESFPILGFKYTPIFYYWKRFRTCTLDVAKTIIIECDYYKEVLGNHFSNKIETLWLFKEQSDDLKKYLHNYIKNYQYDKENINLCYLGSINNIIDINSIKTIIYSLTKTGHKVMLHIIGKGESKEQLIKVCISSGAKVEDHGTIFNDFEKADILSKCDFGLNMMIKTVKVGLTLKSIEYLSNGIPLINNIKGDTWQFVENNNGGINFSGNVNDIIEWVDHYKSDCRNQLYKIYLNYFSKDAFESKYTKIIHSFLNNK